MIKYPGRLLRGGVALLNIIILDQLLVMGPWVIVTAVIATYLMFTAVTGECLVREYLIRPLRDIDEQTKEIAVKTSSKKPNNLQTS